MMRAAWSERLRILVQCDTVAGTPVLMRRWGPQVKGEDRDGVEQTDMCALRNPSSPRLVLKLYSYSGLR